MSDREESPTHDRSPVNGRSQPEDDYESHRDDADVSNHKDRRSRSRSPRKSGGRSKQRSRSRSRSHTRRRRSRSRSHSSSRRHSRSPYNRRRRESDRDNPKPNRCIGIFGLSIRTTEEELRDYFSKFGPVDKIQVVLDTKTGRSRGFAFCYFDSEEDAKAAKEQCSGMEWSDGRRIRVDYSITQRAHTPTPGIYMGRPTRFDYGDRRDYGRGYDRRGRYGDYGGGRSYGRSYRRSPSPRYRSSRRYERSHRSRSYSPRRY